MSERIVYLGGPLDGVIHKGPNSVYRWGDGRHYCPGWELVSNHDHYRLVSGVEYQWVMGRPDECSCLLCAAVRS